jgi:hypothetical protein
MLKYKIQIQILQTFSEKTVVMKESVIKYSCSGSQATNISASCRKMKLQWKNSPTHFNLKPSLNTVGGFPQLADG